MQTLTCYYCNEEFENLGWLNPTNQLVFCSRSCHDNKYGCQEPDTNNYNDEEHYDD